MLVFTDSTPGMPCSWDVDTSCCSSWDTFAPELQTAAAEFGAFIMWAATGRRFGLCQRTVRPCGMYRQNRGDVYGYFWSDGMWLPYIWNGEWRNCWCGCVGGDGCFCTCDPRAQVLLNGPVASIPVTGVSVDGAIVPASSWRVDDGKWLVRTDGELWPECQDYNVDSGAGVFEVTYNVGIEPPSMVLRAAGELACEYGNYCAGLPCRLPQRMSSVARQGVSVTMVNPDDMLRRGLTGIWTVDQVITRINPAGLSGRMRISNPDDPVTRIVTQP